MKESQRERTTARGRAVVVAVVAAVVLAGAGAFVVSGAGATTGGSADWSPHPGKEVTPDDETCPVDYEPASNSSDDDDDDDVNDSDEDVNDSGYVLYITSNVSWTVNVTTEEETMSMDGEGNETIEEISAGENESVRAAIAKTEATNGTVRINLTYDGEVIETDEATNGVVSTDGTSDTGTTGFGSDDSGEGVFEDTENSGEGWDPFGENSQATSDDFSNDSDTENESNNSSGGTDPVDPSDPNDSFGPELLGNSGVDSDDDDSGDSDGNDSEDEDDDDNETVDDEDVPEDCVPVEDEDDTNDSDNDTEDETIESNEEDNETIEVNDTAEVVFDDKDVPENATSLSYESATLTEGGFVVLYDTDMNILGVSRNLSAGPADGDQITLREGIEVSQNVTAVLYEDSNNDGRFGTGDDSNDPGPDARYVYEDDGQTVGDSGDVMVEGDETASSDSDSAFQVRDTTVTGTTTDNNEVVADSSSPSSQNQVTDAQAGAQTTQANAPGFGLGVAAVALLAAALVAVRRQ